MIQAQNTEAAAVSAGGFRRPRDERYTKVAIFLHWAIAALIIYNLLLGFFNWDFGYDWTHQPEHRWFYAFALVSHMSAGMTVLALTIVRIAWRLLHEPPAYPAHMKSWERHLAHFAHFFLYAAMLLMPLSGWAILSAHPPAGSEGAKARDEAAAKLAPPAGAMPAPPAGGGGAKAPGGPGGPPPGGPRGGVPRVWWVLMPMPSIGPIEQLGVTAGGLEPQKVLHDKFAEWHGVGAWLTVLVLLLHIAGALKHQYVDREPQFARMGIGRLPEERV